MMKLKYTLALASGLSFATFAIPALAQMQPQPESVSLPDTTRKMETLSGIHLEPTKKGTYQLDFKQVLKEDAILEITNNAGKLVYQQPISIADSTYRWQFDLGPLRTDSYQVTVKTSDTTYWSKFKVRNKTQVQHKKKRR